MNEKEKDFKKNPRKEEITRRGFIGAGAAGALGLATIAQSASAASGKKLRFDAEYDVVVCGSGAGGLGTALFSRWQGNSVVVLEKSGSIGGTTAKSGFWYWIPNNEPMKKAGIQDPKPDFMKLVARLSAPHSYSPSAPKLGLTDWQYDMCEAYYDTASTAAELLNARGALPYQHPADVVDYWADLPENKAPKGRALLPAGASLHNGGKFGIMSLSNAARRDGISIKTSHRVQSIIRNGRGEVVGVEVTSPEGETLRFRAKKAVVFATGGFTHDPQLRRDFLCGNIVGGCAANSNEGDFIRISSPLGVQLANMNYAWNCPVVFEKAVANDGSLWGAFMPSGDSMVFVNKYGNRVVNEKLQYNEVTRAFWAWDGPRQEYPNEVLIAIWDQQAQDNCAEEHYGSYIVPPGSDDRHVIKGATREELAKNIAARMAVYRDRFNISLAPEFVATLNDTIRRFNEFAKTGKDLDFHRGERPVELMFNGNNKATGKANPTMYPISDTGPFYATLLGPGNLDTKGGPRTDTHGRILDVKGQPIPGLYGVGNCVASASGQAYWSGGATLGPIVTFAYRAANALQKERTKEVTA
ncbi:FAD-dependent oxidoreductase [Telluria mixta]|uniref:FAD-dependent oxidoreductase n=1 Tax=Telluria mixta TaxID=34071 RepID=A0ABT2C322_9BURK|nr:FAD-dependent oxidoreductase [Telluria mixta]MCS0631231.1 FAD-dependent oxidoreductase [Telluria mixta]WEM95771.1 FAD-dependent oxidoreductase [Telluria mixta]